MITSVISIDVGSEEVGPCLTESLGVCVGTAFKKGKTKTQKMKVSEMVDAHSITPMTTESPSSHLTTPYSIPRHERKVSSTVTHLKNH